VFVSVIEYDGEFHASPSRVCITVVFVSFVSQYVFDVLGVCQKVQGDCLCGKLGNVTEFDSCWGNVRKLKNFLSVAVGLVSNYVKHVCLKIIVNISALTFVVYL